VGAGRRGGGEEVPGPGQAAPLHLRIHIRVQIHSLLRLQSSDDVACLGCRPFAWVLDDVEEVKKFLALAKLHLKIHIRVQILQPLAPAILR
jgi:hypothetical protein